MNRAVLVISDQGREFLAKGQKWMYRNNLVMIKGEAEDGGIADLESENGEYIGSGYYSAVSHVCLRILSADRSMEIDRRFFEKKIRAAWSFRRVCERENLDNCRIIFGEADGMPGLILDRYNDILVTQISCSGVEKRKDMIYSIILDVLKEDSQNISGIYERNDVKVREKEGLALYKGFWKDAVLPTETIISENGLKLRVDIENGQKTGYFLDQKSNRVLLRKMAKGLKVCDCFTHTGGFALNAAFGGAAHVTAVDVSGEALKQAAHNARLNGLEDRVEFVQADVFEYLDEIKDGQFDLIVLDPPAFTKSRSTVNRAYNGYKHINKQAMKVLRNGGYLISCSCSRYMETALFEQMLKESAAETGVVLKQVSVTQQNSDHPILWTMAETSYLKFYVFQVNPAD